MTPNFDIFEMFNDDHIMYRGEDGGVYISTQEQFFKKKPSSGGPKYTKPKKKRKK